MAPGELFLEVLSSGVITQKEIDWVLAEQWGCPGFVDRSIGVTP